VHMHTVQVDSVYPPTQLKDAPSRKNAWFQPLSL
jgi:hypothetical protein